MWATATSLDTLILQETAIICSSTTLALKLYYHVLLLLPVAHTCCYSNGMANAKESTSNFFEFHVLLLVFVSVRTHGKRQIHRQAERVIFIEYTERALAII